tara:strand:- start:7800 stop:9170 length:1371 start_codon:yes stop_codon:yes gene_type:complete
MQGNLSQFGHNFQIKSIVCLMVKTDFIEQVYDIVDPKYYDNDALKWIVKECVAYFIKYKKTITLDAFKVIINNIENDILKTSIVEILKEVYQHFEATDLDFVQDKTLDFFKNQKLKNAIVESVEILEVNGDFDSIKKLIDEALRAGMGRDVGHKYLDMIEYRYSNMARDTISTPWNLIDELIQGGLGAGELGVVVAPAGVGKTWVLAKIGSHAFKYGKNVVHFTLELNEAYVGLRYDSIFTGIANQNLKYHQEKVVETLKQIEDTDGGALTIKYFPTKSASVHTLGTHLQKMISLGDKIDLVIVDYADIMKDTSYATEVRHALGSIYEDLRGLAGELKVPIWTASQANRSALEDDVIEASKVAESYQKVMTADFVISLSRKMGDKAADTGRFHIIKNRFGPDGMTFPSKINTDIGLIEIYESNTKPGQEQQKKIDSRDYIERKMLGNKYKHLLEKS